MAQNGTPQPGKSPDLPALEASQLTFVEALTAGATMTAAAEAAGVSRTTAHRWLKLPAVRAEMNGRREEVRNRSRARLLALADDAITTIANAVAAGDVKTSLVVVRSLGLLGEIVVGEVEAVQIEKADAQKKAFDDIVNSAFQ